MLSLPAHEVPGRLTASDPLGRPDGANHYVDDYEFVLETRGTVVAEVVGGTFDTYLHLLDQDCRVLASDDDSGTGLLSKLVVEELSPQVYTIVVSSYSAYVTGTYVLSVDTQN